MQRGTYAEIEKRMLEIGGLKNTSALAVVLKITPQALCNYKNRGEMPSSLIFKFAERFNCSVDYLAAGITTGMTSMDGVRSDTWDNECLEIFKKDCITMLVKFKRLRGIVDEPLDGDETEELSRAALKAFNEHEGNK